MVDFPLAFFGLCDLSEKMIYQFMENNSTQFHIMNKTKRQLIIITSKFYLLF